MFVGGEWIHAETVTHATIETIDAWIHVVVAGSFVAWAIALGRWDFREHRLPDSLTLPAFPLALIAVALVAPANLREAAGFGIVGIALGWALHHLADLGLGDAKLMGACGVLIGVTAHPATSATAAVFGTTVVGGIHALIHLAITKNRTSHIPFGPSILAGTASGLISG